MPRLIIAAVAAATLIFVPSARANLTVSSPAGVTNNPVVTFTDDDPGDGTVRCGVVPGHYDAPGHLDPCTSPWHPTVATDGDYTIEVSNDLHGNVRYFTLDRSGPTIAITTGPDDNSTQVSPTVVYGFTTEDPRNVATTSCTWDTQPAACPDGTTPTTLTPGAHTLVITASDSLGNVSTLTRHVTIASSQLIVDPGPTPTPTPTATPTPDVVPSQGGVLSAGATHATASLSVKKRTRGWTQLKSVTLRGVPAGTTIKVACKGKGCPSKPATQKATKSGSVTIKGIAGRKLHPGATITLTLSQPSAKPQTIKILVRSTRGPRVS